MKNLTLSFLGFGKIISLIITIIGMLLFVIGFYVFCRKIFINLLEWKMDILANYQINLVLFVIISFVIVAIGILGYFGLDQIYSKKIHQS